MYISSMASPWHFFALVFGLCCFSNRARLEVHDGIAFTGEEASGLCSQIFEGHYAEEATCLYSSCRSMEHGKVWKSEHV